MFTKNKETGTNQFQVHPYILDLNVLDFKYKGKIKRKNYPQKNIYTLPNLLTKRECQTIIQKSEAIGFQKAGLAIGQDVYRSKEKTRSNQRMLFEDPKMSAEIWNRMQHLVDYKFDNHYAQGLNWRFRVYKYTKGNLFAPHVDERMTLPEGKGITLFTFMIYLNENMEGGATTFFDRRKKGSNKMTINRIIRPKTGMGLAFDHLLFHEGSKVEKGIKYVLRSDLYYKKK